MWWHSSWFVPFSCTSQLISNEVSAPVVQWATSKEPAADRWSQTYVSRERSPIRPPSRAQPFNSDSTFPTASESVIPDASSSPLERLCTHWIKYIAACLTAEALGVVKQHLSRSPSITNNYLRCCRSPSFPIRTRTFQSLWVSPSAQRIPCILLLRYLLH